jgi:putative alpha-1,2-mannosidase
MPLNQFWFKHSTLAKGGELELWLGPEPNKKWGVGKLPEK